MANPPLISPIFQLSGTVLQYKPHVDASVWTDLIDLSPFSPVAQVYPDCAYLTPSMFRTITNGFAAPTLQSGQWTHAYSDLNGDGSKSECKILLAAGDYDVSIGYVKATNAGRLAVKVDGTVFPVSRIDMYTTPTTLLGQLYEGTLITGLSSGLHTIQLLVDGKNISSSAFHCLVSFVAIRKKP